MNLYMANRLREVFLSGKWIANTNYADLLEDVDLNQARQQVANLNTIAALTFHINYYLEGLLNVFRGGELAIKDQYSFDMAPLESEEDWQKLKVRFLQNASDFADEVEQMTIDQLNAPFVKEQYGSYLRNIEGVIEHSYYHMGQVSIIKKMIRSI